MIPLSRDSIVYQKLIPISKLINEIDCQMCNTGSDNGTLTVQALLEEAAKILEPLGLKPFHQSDPRGCSLYIIDDTMNDSNYTNGIPVYQAEN